MCFDLFEVPLPPLVVRVECCERDSATTTFGNTSRRLHVNRQDCSPEGEILLGEWVCVGGGGGSDCFEWGIKMYFLKRLKTETYFAPKGVKNHALWFHTYL